jgi:hypothetical protein
MNRRTVIRRAVKLAYATPLIAATVRMDQKGAAASPGDDRVCGTGFLCLDGCCDHECVNDWCEP